MVRAPCCESMGLKKGPWTREEDHILINYINMYGHGNWRALPKLAGLLRCGKSCRLRWTNYLRPDIKRGNFSTEEEETIKQLHAALGNRWSAIAARLTGRTDNEIKNVWHTHLKKRVNEAENKCLVSNFPQETHGFKKEEIDQSSPSSSSKPFNGRDDQANCSHLNSPQHSYSDISSVVTNDNGDIKVMGNSQETDEDFWTEIFSSETSRQFTMSEEEYKYKSSMNDDMQFWFNVFTGGDELSEI